MRDRIHKKLHRERPSNDDAPLRVADMDEDEAVTLFETLGSETTYRAYRHLHEEPKLPRELAAALDSSIQNIHYHLGKLEDAELIESVDTWHSDNGVEMKVYAPVHEPLVISFGSETNRERIQTLLSRVFGIIGAISFSSLIAKFVVASRTSSESADRDEVAGMSEPPADGESSVLFDNIAVEVVQSSPGITLFLLGVTLVSAYTALHLARREPPV